MSIERHLQELLHELGYEDRLNNFPDAIQCIRLAMARYAMDAVMDSRVREEAEQICSEAIQSSEINWKQEGF